MTEPITDKELSAMKSFFENRAHEYRAFADAPKVIDQWQRALAEFKALPKQREAIVKEIADLETKKLEAESRTRGAEQDAHRAQADTDAKKEELGKQLAALDREIQAKQRQIAGLDGEYAERMQAKELELGTLQGRLDAMNAEIERIKKQFGA